MKGAETIFALSSGSPPAGIAVVRVSGPQAADALAALSVQELPTPRQATLVTLRDRETAVLDRALILWFPGPASATGDDVVELHVHGGRAVVNAVLDALSTVPGLRTAQPGEFTRRAFENGRIDLAEAEGLGDLLRAETEAQRRSAVAQAGGALGRMIGAWQARLLALSAQVEAVIDFSDEDDIRDGGLSSVRADAIMLVSDMKIRLADPPAERLYNGVRVVIMGPPNAGKSSLFNTLVSREAAIVSPVPGTTRDVVEASVNLRGLSLIFVDTAGLRDATEDAIEAIGMSRARDQGRVADIVLALGGGVLDTAGASIISVAAKCDLGRTSGDGIAVSSVTGEGIDNLIHAIEMEAAALLPGEASVALNHRHRAAIAEAVGDLECVPTLADEILVAEHLRSARRSLQRIAGSGNVEDMLDLLFGTFCVGK